MLFSFCGILLQVWPVFIIHKLFWDIQEHWWQCVDVVLYVWLELLPRGDMWLTRRESGRSCGHEDLGKKLETKKYRNVKERNSLFWSISRFRTIGFCYVNLMAQFCRIFTKICRIVKSMSKFPSGVTQPCNLKGGAVKVHFPFAVEVPQWLRRYNVSCSC